VLKVNDQDFLRLAIQVGNTQEEPRNFGAVIVKDGQVIASDCNHVHDNHDPTAHAETSAIRLAAKKLNTHNLEGCTMYGSHEPCLMCFSCAVWARIDRIVYAEAANEQGFTYEFEGVSIKELAGRLTRYPVIIEHIPVIDLKP